MSDSPTSARIEPDIPRAFPDANRFSIDQVRSHAEAWSRDRKVRALISVDGVRFPSPLVIEEISLGDEPTGFAADFTVWGSRWMFGISVPRTGQGNDPLFVEIKVQR